MCYALVLTQPAPNSKTKENERKEAKEERRIEGEERDKEKSR